MHSEEARLRLHNTGISLYSDGTLAGLQFELSANYLEDLHMALELHL